MQALVPTGTRIAVVAPSHAYQVERLDAGLAMAGAAGHDLHLLTGDLRPERTFAGSRAQRLDTLVHALTAPEYGAVWMVRGGSGITDLLSGIPWDRLPQRPVIGFSDATALLVALHQRVGSPVVHGPVLHSLPTHDEASVTSLFALLRGDAPAPLPGETWVGGAAEGPLVGGNLVLLSALCGTPWQLDARGAVLFLEEIGEHPYRIERMLVQLRDSGVLDGVVGVALGGFTDCEAPPSADWTLRDALMAHLGPLGVPVVAGLPIGHGTQNHSFRYGARVVLDGGLRFSRPLA